MISIVREGYVSDVRLLPDWRERLARNLGRPSAGRWEPLDTPTGYVAGALYSALEEVPYGSGAPPARLRSVALAALPRPGEQYAPAHNGVYGPFSRRVLGNP